MDVIKQGNTGTSPYADDPYNRVDNNALLPKNLSAIVCEKDELFVQNVYIFLEKARTADVIVMTAFLSLVGLLGCVGNIAVILVCYKYPTRQSTQHFILAMAICDLFVCIAIIPYRIISYHMLLMEATCKFFEGLTYLSVQFSLFLLMAVAVDRYHAVCRPVTYHRMSKTTGHMILSISITTFGISTYAGLIAGHYINIPITTDENETETVQCFTGICNEDGQDRRFSTKLSVNIYSFFFGVLYISLVVIVFISYSKVFRSLYSRYASGPNRQTHPLANTGDVSIAMVSVSQSCLTNGGEAAKIETKAISHKRNHEKKSRARNKISHRRTAKILLLVTVAFILTWVPFLLMKTRLVRNIVTIRLTFFLSNMINPMIYSFTNKQFRDNVMRMLGHKGEERNSV